ncbi:DUF805 domain-containing protein [Altererythrobacter xixiisoli]|uniref:DUF805 domain-containing protein n=2 Tax=Croceibacterium xixiisoli TaxID=1476466 RepID=A0A6I4TUH2_9SPHN|nr:DUF805 domain-containing protein [Croceibacterium xixiisoli]
MLHWAILPLKRYTDFSGRSRRMEYWSFTLFTVIATFVLMIPALTSFSGLDWENPDSWFADGNFPIGMIISGILFAVFWLGILIPSIALTIRRLHDRNMSGWFYLGFVVLSNIPAVGFVISIAFLVIMFLPGTSGPNTYGLDPKNPYQDDVFA